MRWAGDVAHLVKTEKVTKFWSEILKRSYHFIHLRVDVNNIKKCWNVSWGGAVGGAD